MLEQLSPIFILQKIKEKVFCQENLTKVSQEKLTELAYHLLNFIYFSALFVTRKQQHQIVSEL